MRRKINDDILDSVCSTDDGTTAYTGSEDGTIKKYNVRGGGAEITKEKEVKVGDLYVGLGLSIFPTNQNVAAVDV